jgi:hypothetical protein
MAQTLRCVSIRQYRVAWLTANSWRSANPAPQWRNCAPRDGAQKETADAEIKTAKEIVDNADTAMKEALLLQVET